MARNGYAPKMLVFLVKGDWSVGHWRVDGGHSDCVRLREDVGVQSALYSTPNLTRSPALLLPQAGAERDGY